MHRFLKPLCRRARGEFAKRANSQSGTAQRAPLSEPPSPVVRCEGYNILEQFKKKLEKLLQPIKHFRRQNMAKVIKF